MHDLDMSEYTKETDPYAHEQVDLPGWTQGGTINDGGYKYSSWSRLLNDRYAFISQGMDTGRYWIEWQSCMHGNWATPQAAAKHIEKLAARLEAKDD